MKCIEGVSYLLFTCTIGSFGVTNFEVETVFKGDGSSSVCALVFCFFDVGANIVCFSSILSSLTFAEPTIEKVNII